MAVKTYDPGQVSIIIGGFDISQGLADGTFITVARDEPMWTSIKGAAGEVTRSKSNDKSGTLTFTCMQSSDANDILSGFAAADEYGNAGLFPALVKDASGRSVYSAETAWIEKYSDSEFGREATSREWVIKTDTLIPFIGGNE